MKPVFNLAVALKDTWAKVEPKHVHVRRERNLCKFWLEPIVLAANDGFSPTELNRIRGIIEKNLYRIVEAWDEHCGE